MRRGRHAHLSIVNELGETGQTRSAERVQQFADFVVLAPSFGANPLLELGAPLLQLGERGERDRDERVERFLDEGVQLLPGRVEDAERRRQDCGVNRLARPNRGLAEDRSQQGVLRLFISRVSDPSTAQGRTLEIGRASCRERVS